MRTRHARIVARMPLSAFIARCDEVLASSSPIEDVMEAIGVDTSTLALPERVDSDSVSVSLTDDETWRQFRNLYPSPEQLEGV